MTVPGDYHVHTTWSDGTGSVEECVLRAVELGLPEIGIADHVSATPGPDDDWWLRPEHIAGYCDDVRAAADRHPEIRVLLGIEAEYLVDREAEMDALLAAWPFELVVLGIHETDGFVFDDPDLRSDPHWADADRLLAAYYRTVRRGVEHGGFDILAHVDYIGLWGDQPGPEAAREIDAVLDALAASGAALELNTDRFCDPAGVMYPSPAILRAARRRDIPLTIDSDAHEAAQVGRAWDEAIDLAWAAGYRETLRVSDGVLVPLSRRS